LFGIKRFHEVRMEDIAAEAGVSKGTLYRYFRDKDDMYLSLLERASHQLTAELTARVAEAEGARARLVAVVKAVIAFFDGQPHLFDLIQRAEIGHEQGKRFPWQEARDKGMRIVLEIFEEAKQSRELIFKNPESAMLMLLGGMRAIIRAGRRPRARRLAETLVDDFLHGSATIAQKKRLTRSAS